MLDSVIQWVRNTENWLLSAIPFLGAFVALARQYEQSDRVRTIRQHIKDYLWLLVYSLAGAILGTNAAEHMGWSKQAVVICCLLGSVFSKGILDLLWRLMQVRLRKVFEKE